MTEEFKQNRTEYKHYNNYNIKHNKLGKEL
jgi:hypothetical protein